MLSNEEKCGLKSYVGLERGRRGEENEDGDEEELTEEKG